MQRGGIEAKFIEQAIECHMAFSVNQIESAWPASIRLLRNVVETIDSRDEWDFELAHAGGGVLTFLLELRRVGEGDSLPFIDRAPPRYGSVGLANINQQELSL